jgi:peptidoglycan hydrolase-like protein with peptidoglycan-binding domain
MFNKLLLLILITLAIGTVSINAQETTSTSSMDTSATSDAPKKRGPIFRPNKDQIMQVQKILKTKKLYDGDASGKYNDETRAGIKSFQRDNGLRTTGTLNRATLEAFKIELTDYQKTIPASPNSYVSAEGDKTPHNAVSMNSTENSEARSDENRPKRTIFRANSDQVSAAQNLLKSSKMYDGDITGKLNDETREGLRKYQEANGVRVTGTLNAVTLESMGIELTDKQKADKAAAEKAD